MDAVVVLVALSSFCLDRLYIVASEKVGRLGRAVAIANLPLCDIQLDLCCRRCYRM